MKGDRGERKTRTRRALAGPACALCFLILLAAAPGRAAAGDGPDPQALVDRAARVMERFDGRFKPFWSKEKARATAVLVVPRLVRAGAGFGGGGGSGVLLVRDPETGAWSEPAFYNLAAVSLLVQAGADVTDLVMVVRTAKGARSFRTFSFKLGGDVRATAAIWGIGSSSASSMTGRGSDIVGFEYGKGLYLGLTLEGTFVSVSKKNNRAYYGQGVNPADILSPGPVRNPGSRELIEAVEAVFR